MKYLRSPNEIIGLNVEVYFNLHKKVFSVRHKGRVYAHLPELILDNVQFVVRENGRQKVLLNKQKNVHAFVRGIFKGVPDTLEELKINRCISYDPYKHNAFFDKGVYLNEMRYDSIKSTHHRILLKHKQAYELL